MDSPRPQIRPQISQQIGSQTTPQPTVEPTWPPEPLYVAVDIALYTVDEDRLWVLLTRRPYLPFEGWWALPGAFSRTEETLDETARRALTEKTGVHGVWLEQLGTYDQPRRGEAPGRDPRGRVVSVAYLALVSPDPWLRVAPAGGPATSSHSRIAWWPVDQLPLPLAFDHERILGDALARLRAKTRYAPVAFQLLPREFTLGELQAVYEAVVGQRLDVRNFRRDLRSSGVIEHTGTSRRTGPGRPARLYRYVQGDFAVDALERRVAEQITRDARAE